VPAVLKGKLDAGDTGERTGGRAADALQSRYVEEYRQYHSP
jgi:hypothetical protein